MRTSVVTPEDQDEFPDCSAVVGSDGQVTIVDSEDNVETVYEKGDWIEVITFAKD